MNEIAVIAAGLLSTVQDGGRHGHGALGVGCAGAMDTVALRLANALVGNAQHAAALEITLRGPRLRLRDDAVIAITGAPIQASCAGVALPAWQTLSVRGGSEITFGAVRRGARSYLAIRGGIGAPLCLGSRSTDLHAGIGAALAAGDVLACAMEPANVAPRASGTAAAFCAAKWALDPAPWFDAADDAPILVTRGAQFERLDAPSQHALFAQPFRIGADSNRVGYRFEGTALALQQPYEAVSAGVVAGTLQLPPGGAPIALMAEAPTTGGYARIAHIASVELPKLAQRRPGQSVRFAEITLQQAQTRYLDRERALAAVARHIAERLHG